MKTELTRESIVEAIISGAKTVSQVAIAHGYTKPISGGTTKKIRAIVPEVETLFAAPTAKQEATQEAPQEATQEAPQEATQEATQEAPEVAKEKPVKAPKALKVPKEKPVKAPKVRAPLNMEGISQRHKPYGGKVYGAVFAAAVEAGEVEFRTFVKETATKLNFSEQQVFVAANVMRIPKHQSNGYRSQDISEKRGFMHLVAVVPAEVSAVKTTIEPAVETVTADATEVNAI